MQPTIHPGVKTEADLNLERRVALTLAGLHVPLFRFLRVDANNGSVTLSGRVGSYYERQLAQSRARRVAGVVRLIDALVVVERPARGSSGYAALLTRPLSKSIPTEASSLAATRAVEGRLPDAGSTRRIA